MLANHAKSYGTRHSKNRYVDEAVLSNNKAINALSIQPHSSTFSPSTQGETALSLLATSCFSSILCTRLSKSNWKSFISIVGTNSGAFVNK
jgi:hypothetical protein